MFVFVSFCICIIWKMFSLCLCLYFVFVCLSFCFEELFSHYFIWFVYWHFVCLFAVRISRKSFCGSRAPWATWPRWPPSAPTAPHVSKQKQKKKRGKEKQPKREQKEWQLDYSFFVWIKIFRFRSSLNSIVLWWARFQFDCSLNSKAQKIPICSLIPDLSLFQVIANAKRILFVLRIFCFR